MNGLEESEFGEPACETPAPCAGAFEAARSGANAVGSAPAVCTSPSSRTRVMMVRAEKISLTSAARSFKVSEEELSFEELKGCEEVSEEELAGCEESRCS